MDGRRPGAGAHTYDEAQVSDMEAKLCANRTLKEVLLVIKTAEKRQTARSNP